jgi:hypothetical protein
MPPKKMMQGWRVYATLMLYVVPLFESPMMMMYDDVCETKWVGRWTNLSRQAGKSKSRQAAFEDTDH